MNLRSGSVVGQGVLPVEGRPYFEEGCRLVFERWTALQLAIENGWGGHQSKEKALDVLDDVTDWFYRRKDHYNDELEEELLAAMSEEFNCDCEDGSPGQVARELIQLYQELCRGDLSGLERLRISAKANIQQSQQQQVDRDGTVLEGDDSDMEECDDEQMDDAQPPQLAAAEPPPPREPIVDSDGFTLVQSNRRRR
mmetsp:Transcript_32097/g.91017  ORF Transcript_32097/g.91017 Transcript_32097/m.91017 type:complete len:196 (-) Transcript_32097:305-892(-)